ncbi:putative uncharacterized protein [Xanthomonas citri pv. punicae str. LMG 859]|nr:putative uncharacterized protein [Xanthomonas citri pv. punicae str. LMG 859]
MRCGGMGQGTDAAGIAGIGLYSVIASVQARMPPFGCSAAPRDAGFTEDAALASQ